MKTIDLNNTVHNFEKSNRFTITTKRGGYDIMKCSKCGMIGKTYALGVLTVRNKYKDKKINHCNLTKKEIQEKSNKLLLKSITITNCTACGEVFKNLKPGAIHQVIEPPNPYTNDLKGVWVMGVGEPVKVLKSEFFYNE